MLIGLVCFASVSSIALGGKIIIEGEKSGYNVVEIRKSLKELLRQKDREYLIVGPTEIWPLIEEDRNVLIVDKTRSGKNFDRLEPIIDSVDYIIINKDWSEYRWEERFLRYFPDLYLEKIGHIGSQDQFIKIYKLEKKVFNG